MTESLTAPLPADLFDKIDQQQVIDDDVEKPLITTRENESEMFSQTASFKASIFNLVNSIVGETESDAGL
jgi:hypothetical protein